MSLSRVIPPAVFVTILALLSLPMVEAQSPFGSSSQPDPDPIALAAQMGVSDLSVQSLPFFTVPDSPELIVEVEIAGQFVTLSLFPHSVRGDEFRVLVDDGSGTLTEVPAPPILTRRGTAIEIPDSKVFASWDGVGLHAQIQTPDRSYSIQPVSDFAVGHAASWHVVIDNGDILPNGHTCGVTSSGTFSGPSGGVQQFGGPTLNLTEIAFDVDFEAYSILGSSVTSTVNTVDSIVNGVENAFDDGSILIGYELTTVVVRTNVADPYGTATNVDVLLNDFRGTWNSAPESAIDPPKRSIL